MRRPDSQAVRDRLFEPVAAPLLRDRRLSAVLALAGLTQVGLTLAHVGGLPCPFMRVTGLPCPGCGLSRGCAAACGGHWARAVRYHAFAPVFLVTLVAFATAAVLPSTLVRRLTGAMSAAERRWPIVPLLLVLLLLYWCGRIGYAPAATASLLAAGN